MNTLEIEDRVRAATRAAANTVAPDSVPPLRLASDRPSRSRGSRSRASVWGQWLAPMAAAAAVVAVAVAMVTVGRTVNDRTGGTGVGASSSRPGPVKPGPPISSYVASGRVPRYYVSIDSLGNPNFHPSYAVVRATATGGALETYSPPAGQTVMAITAAADDRTFVLDTQPFVSANANQSFEPRTFREIRLSPSGSIMSESTLPVSVPGGQLMTGFALSPDGSKLAIAVQPDNNKREPDLTQVKVITLATGATRTWTANGTIGFGPDDARSLSWTDDERTLAFDWEGSGLGLDTGIWLLNLGKGGDSLLADSREAVSLINETRINGMPLPSVSPLSYESESLPVLAPAAATDSSSASAGSASPSASPTSAAATDSSSASAGSASPSASPTSAAATATTPTCQEDSIITPDGSTIVCGAITATKANDSITGSGPVAALLQRGAETEFIEYSPSTGKVARVLGHWTFGSVGALSVEVLWSNASGSVLIGVIPDSGDGRVGVISGNEFTPLSGPGAASAAMQSGTW
jgi:hypothetical protein